MIGVLAPPIAAEVNDGATEALKMHRLGPRHAMPKSGERSSLATCRIALRVKTRNGANGAGVNVQCLVVVASCIGIDP